MPNTHVSRRRALQTAAGFMILPSGLARGYAANEKLNLGIIGLAGMGRVDARAFHQMGENVAALCDVDAAILDKRAADYPNARKYTDFRLMIEKEKLDGVGVAAPDHNHAYISVFAMKHGLHTYCQKPLCRTVEEARIMARVAAETRLVTQMGTASSSDASILRTVELIQSGAIGEITEVHVATDRPIWPQGYDRVPGDDPAPATLNWDLWLGPAARRPFQAKWPAGHAVYDPERRRMLGADGAMYHPFSWRGWIDFGSGALGDIAPHAMNVIFMALDLGAPSAVEVVATSGIKKEMFPDWSVIRFDWAPRGVHPKFSIYWYDGNRGLPPELEPPKPPGDQRPLRAGRGGIVWIGTKGRYPSAEQLPAPPARDWGREEVHKDWVTAIKSGKQPGCHFGYAGPFTEAYQLGNVALRVGHRIEWDPLAFRITNCREANQYLRCEYRKGWEVT